MEIEFSKNLAELRRRRPAEDEDIRLYLAGLLYWADRFRKSDERITEGDFVRLNTSLDDFDHVVGRYNNMYWKPLTMGRRFEPTNRLLEQFSAGLFPGSKLIPVFQAQQVLASPRYEAARHHFDEAIAGLRADSPKLPTVAKEAVNALESLAKVVTGLHRGELGDRVKTLRQRGLLRPPLDKVFDAMSGYRGETPGVGHGGVTVPNVSMAEARLVTNSAAAAILFLVELDRTVQQSQDSSTANEAAFSAS